MSKGTPVMIIKSRLHLNISICLRSHAIALVCVTQCVNDRRVSVDIYVADILNSHMGSEKCVKYQDYNQIRICEGDNLSCRIHIPVYAYIDKRDCHT